MASVLGNVQIADDGKAQHRLKVVGGSFHLAGDGLRRCGYRRERKREQQAAKG